MSTMWDRLAELDQRHGELEALLSSPEIISDRAKFQEFSKEHRDLSELVATFRRYRETQKQIAENTEIARSERDADLRAMAEEEAKELQLQIAPLEQQLKLLLIPKDPNDSKNVILEIRAGAGGDEASIFVGDLFRMYCRYVETRGWKVELMGSSEGSAGGFKEIIAMIKGEGAYSRLKYESGVHRVQRVPATETQGRIHTSTVTLAVLPEAEEVEVNIQEKDLRIDVYRAGGPGGQSVNTTDSAVRITHLPTGIVVAMQDEKSQTKNKDKGMRVLRARIFEKMRREQDDARSAERRGQVGSGDRAEKIRTYNYPQSRITDHRIGLTVYNLQDVVEGNVDDLIDPIVAHYQAEALGQKIVKKSDDADQDD